MVYLIVVISLISLVLNYRVYKKVTATYMVGTLEEFTVPTYLCSCSNVEHFEPEEPEQEEKSIVTPMVQNDYQAWTNKKDIPWVPPTSIPEPVKPSIRGPLERPPGFV